MDSILESDFILGIEWDSIENYLVVSWRFSKKVGFHSRFEFHGLLLRVKKLTNSDKEKKQNNYFKN